MTQINNEFKVDFGFDIAVNGVSITNEISALSTRLAKLGV